MRVEEEVTIYLSEKVINSVKFKMEIFSFDRRKNRRILSAHTTLHLNKKFLKIYSGWYATWNMEQKQKYNHLMNMKFRHTIDKCNRIMHAHTHTHTYVLPLNSFIIIQHVVVSYSIHRSREENTKKKYKRIKKGSKGSSVVLFVLNVGVSFFISGNKCFE